MECFYVLISVPTVLAEMNHLMTTQGLHPCVIDKVRAEIMPVILAGCRSSLSLSITLSSQSLSLSLSSTKSIAVRTPSQSLSPDHLDDIMAGQTLSK